MDTQQVEERVNVRCSICVNTFTFGTLRKKVTCKKCHTDICAQCIKRFLSDTLQEPNCMNCHDLYTADFLDENFTKTYRKTVLNQVRATIVAENEKRFLPELQHRAVALRQYDKLFAQEEEARINYFKTEEMLYQLKATWKKAALVLNRSDIPATDDTYKEAQAEFDRVSQEIPLVNTLVKDTKKLIDEIHDEQSKQFDIYYHGANQTVTKVYNCVKEGCKGFVDEASQKCGLCNTLVCQHCRLEITTDGTEHVCKKEDIETINAINKETKPCPTCNTRIFKMFGCDQMWCTSCHTTFSWNTGRIERGRVHNPHYQEWVRANSIVQFPREVGDVPCGGLPPLKGIQDKFKELNVSPANFVYMTVVYKMTQNIATREMNKYQVIQGRTEESNIASIQYLADKISEKVWISKLLKIEQKKEMNKEHRLILDMLLAVLIDYFRGMVSEVKNNTQIIEMLDEIEELRKYFNTVSESLNKRFDCKNFKNIPLDWSKFV